MIDPVAGPSETEIHDLLAAYSRQRELLGDARASLADATHELLQELGRRRLELEDLRRKVAAHEAGHARQAEEYTKLAAYTADLAREATAAHAAYATLHGELVTLQNSRLMRSSALLRSAARACAKLARRVARPTA